jgi:hypothetical protein
MLAGAHRILAIVTRRQGTANQAETIGKHPSMRRGEPGPDRSTGCWKRSAAAARVVAVSPSLLGLPAAHPPPGRLGLPTRTAGDRGHPLRPAPAHLGRSPPPTQDLPLRPKRLTAVR